jgi:hypothetical protein
MKIYLTLILFGLTYLSGICKDVQEKTGQENRPAPSSNVTFAGVRSSRYGIKPFPQPREWIHAIRKIQGYFAGSAPSTIWIVGIQTKKTNCKLGFPGNRKFKNIIFGDTDKNGEFLNFFDKEGIKVFLQVEPADADVPTLIDLVLERYKHHPCVIGMGIDVEWFREASFPGWGKRVSNSTARLWEARVKCHNPAYTLFLKHWDRRWMPPNYRGDIMFISDSQKLGTFNRMLKEFVNYWAAYFFPSPVGFQVGYQSDYPWWKHFKNPVRRIGEALSQRIPQECSIFWVDFTLRSVISFE